MPSPREYREHLYRLRTHPEGEDSPFLVDRRDSFLTVYLSAIPFFGVEWMLQRIFGLPPGLMMPVGFLLFWAFYYTYYKPGFLEERLSSPSNWRLGGVLTVLLGVFIWFVKVTVVELSQLLLLRWLVGRPAPARQEFQRVPERPDAMQSGSYREFSGSWNVGTKAQANAKGAPEAPRPAGTPPPLMSAEVRAALHVLGLPAARLEWDLIHRRYRELAKKFHPDLNKERTDVGRHFMLVDAAYRRLAPMRGKFFPEKQRVNG